MNGKRGAWKRQNQEIIGEWKTGYLAWLIDAVYMCGNGVLYPIKMCKWYTLIKKKKLYKKESSIQGLVVGDWEGLWAPGRYRLLSGSTDTGFLIINSVAIIINVIVEFLPPEAGALGKVRDVLIPKAVKAASKHSTFMSVPPVPLSEETAQESQKHQTCAALLWGK